MKKGMQPGGGGLAVMIGMGRPVKGSGGGQLGADESMRGAEEESESPEEEAAEPEGVEFDTPKGFSVPSDVEEGGTFEALATIRLCEGGGLELVKLDGMPLGGESEEEEGSEVEGEEAPEGNVPGAETGFADAVAQGMAKRSARGG